MKALCSLLLFCFLTGILYAQTTDRNQKYSLSQISEDLDFYITTLKTQHPNIYAYVPEADFNKRVEQVRLQLTDSMNLFEFGKTLLSLNHCLDGHSGITYYQLKEFYTKTEEQEENIRQGFGFLFPDSITNNSIYIHGKKTVTINGKNCEQIVKQCQLYTNQGDETNLQECRLRYSFPTIAYYLLDITPPYEITYQDKTTETVKGSDGDLCVQFRGYCYSNPFHWKIYSKESIAYLEFNTCVRSEVSYPDKFNATLDSLFQELKNNKCNNLFIDITRNSGGSGYVTDALLRRFKNDSLTLKLTHIPKLGMNSPKSPVIEYYNRYPVKSGYDGNVFLITGPWTYSATRFICVAMRVSGRGTFIGETPGQSNEEYTDAKHFKMPNTQLSFSCASVGYHWDVDLTPDIPWNINCSHEPFTLEDLKKMIELNRNRKK